MIYGSPVRGTIHPASWVRPAGNGDFKITQVYGCTGFPAEPPYGGCAHYHRGIDLGNTKCGADVLAVAAGVVTLAGADKLSGNALRVVIKHADGSFSLYYHLHDYAVRAGQAVAKGQVIGHVGTTGWSTACHLHFELHEDSDRLSFFDPWPHLEQNVTIHPKTGTVINIRNSPGGPVFAVAKLDGRIHQATDNTDLGPTAAWRKWGGIVTGPAYTVSGVTSTRWERTYLAGAYRFVASLLAVRSAS